MGVIGHGGLFRVFSFARPIRGFGHVYGIYPQTCPDGRRLGFRYAIYCWNSVAFCTTPLSSGRIVPRVTIARVTLFIPRERPNVQHSIVGFSRLPQPTPAGAALALLLSGGTRVCHWQSARRLWPDMRRLQLPLDDCCNRNLMVG